ncbi:MAG: SMC family ATPase [bacterium]
MIKIKKLIADNFKQLKDIEITFPQRGSFLIEGLNESGKSTLFEAIYFGLFGEALVSERRSLVELINYHSKSAYIQLQVEIRDRILTIDRILNLNSPNQWKLNIGDEVITKNIPVNERLMLELGLDGDALLNSCFVEQKKLDKLEGLDKSQREKSLMKLLNLDRLLELEQRFKVRRDEEKDLQYKLQKLELAKLKQIELHKTLEAKKRIDIKLQIINLIRLKQKINEETTNIKRLFKSIKLIEPQKIELEKKINRVGELKKTQNHLEKLISNLTQIKEQEAEINNLKKQVQDLEALNEKVPVRKKLTNEILCLSKRLARINKLEDLHKFEKEKGISLDKELEQIKKLKGTINLEETKFIQKQEKLNLSLEKEKTLAQQLKSINEKEALENWRRAKYTLYALEIINQKEKEINSQKDIKQQEKTNADHRYKKTLFTSIGINIVSIISLIISLINGLLAMGIIMVVITLAALFSGFINIKNQKKIIYRLSLTIRELEDEILRLDGQRQSTRDKNEQDETKLIEYENKLLKLNLSIPEDITQADALINDLSENLKGFDIQQVKEDYSKITKDIAGQESAVSLSKNVLENYKQELNKLNEEEKLKDKEKSIIRKDKLSKIIDKFKPKLHQKAKNLGVILDREKLLAEYNQLLTEVKRDLQDVSKKEQFLEKISQHQEIVTKLKDEINTIYTSTLQISRDLSLRDYPRLKNKVIAEINEIQEEKTLQEFKTLQSQIDAYRGEINLRQKTQTELENEMQNFPNQIKKAFKYSRLQVQYEPTLIKEKEDIEAKIGYIRTHVEKLARELHLENVRLEVTQCEKEIQDLSNSLKIRTLAEQILTTARNNIVARVLPNTIRNMQKILPLLTCDRYHDADITEDYKIKVWDERAMRWCAKNIFSGGTKDQFSLALRMAFAIATLPQEKGIAPSFIFLDEPLSSFDVERAQALIYLLTQGEIMQTFDQIFVISHSQLLASSMFNYYIKMDNGRIVEHNLG